MRSGEYRTTGRGHGKNSRVWKSYVEDLIQRGHLPAPPKYRCPIYIIDGTFWRKTHIVHPDTLIGAPYTRMGAIIRVATKDEQLAWHFLVES